MIGPPTYNIVPAPLVFYYGRTPIVGLLRGVGDNGIDSPADRRRLRIPSRRSRATSHRYRGNAVCAIYVIPSLYYYKLFIRGYLDLHLIVVNNIYIYNTWS